MEDLTITKILTNNGVTFAYELSNGKQLTIEDAIELAREQKISNAKAVIDQKGFTTLVGDSNSNCDFSKLPHENINSPSD